MGSPVDDALDRLLAIVEAAEKEGRWHLSGRDVINMTQAVATVREALERLRANQRTGRIIHGDATDDAWNERAFDQQKARAEAAEDEVRRLTEGLRPFVEDYDFHAADYLADMVDGEEARVFTARTVESLIEDQRKARALLSASPSDGGGAK